MCGLLEDLLRVDPAWETSGWIDGVIPVSVLPLESNGVRIDGAAILAEEGHWLWSALRADLQFEPELSAVWFAGKEQGVPFTQNGVPRHILPADGNSTHSFRFLLDAVRVANGASDV